ncbi:MAG: site-specific DNA-methyltransferase [Kiritimatiellae bacterium]|nr:site-specific DNA-methyltransferase [Kiritimatiellia bacterium]
MKTRTLLLAAVAVLNLFAEGEYKMPMLKWAGKEKVVNHHNDVPFRVLERKWGWGSARTEGPDNPETPEIPGGFAAENMVIHGDNLAALKALMPQYEGKVKCIYIDPPYNTGNEGWVYNDNVNDPQIKKWLGEVVGKEGEDFSRHDKWLCMMYPRLRLLQKLLSNDGAIFISIDDNELCSLKFICDEIFGSRNFVSNFIWYNTGHTDKQEDITNVHEYILCYAKSKPALHMNNVVDPATATDSKIRNSFAENSITKNGFKNPPSEILLPKGFPCESESLVKLRHEKIEELIAAANEKRYITREITKKYGISYPARIDDMVVKSYQLSQPCRVFSGWMNNGKLKQFIANDFKPLVEDDGTQLRFYLSKNGVIYYRRDGRKNHYVQTVLQNQDTTEKNKYMLESMGIQFDYPKPTGLIEYLLSFYCTPDAIVLDSFAGSGTTAHAVLKMNKEDGGNRKFILIEMMDYADTVTAERVKRVISGYGEGDKAVEGTGGGFGYYELGDPLMIGENLNEALPLEKIREYVWYMETRGARRPEKPDNPDNPEKPVKPDNPENPGEPYLLGVADGTAYYFCYERGKVVKLNRALLRKLKTKAERYVIYADLCLLDDSELERYNITFKKIPRDIARL